MNNALSNPNRIELLYSKYAMHHIGYKRWEIVSQNAGNQSEIWSTIFELGKNNLKLPNNDNQQKFNCCGEEFYMLFRPLLIQNKLIWGLEPLKKKKPETKNPVKKNQKQNKAQQIRYENTLKRITTDVNNVIKSLDSDVGLDKDVVFSYKFLELALVKMMNLCKKMASDYEAIVKEINGAKSSKFTSKQELLDLDNILNSKKNELIELVIGFNKIIAEKNSVDTLSTTCLCDLVKWIDYIKDLIKFDPSKVIIQMPELIFKTIYDKMLQNKKIGLYPSQTDIFNFVTNNPKYLALVHTMLGSGKTTMVLPICGWLLQNRKSLNSKIIYCCPNTMVLFEVANMAYNIGIPFAIAIRNQENGEVEFKPATYVNGRDQTIVLYICDIYVTKILLEKRMESYHSFQKYMDYHSLDPYNYPLTENRIPIVPDYILIGDELTKDADSQEGFMTDAKFSVVTETFVNLMKIAPPKIILMSATLPTIDQLDIEYQSIIRNHPGMVCKSFTPTEAKIGCALISQSGKLFAPHIGCKTVDELKHMLKIVETNPFIGRFYTFEILLHMVNRNKKMNLSYPDLSFMFNDPSLATQNNIQSCANQILNTIINTNDDIIVTNACSQLDLNKVGNGVNLSKILTSDIHRFNKGCLIFSSDPVSSAIQIYKDNFDSNGNIRNIFQQINIDSILEDYSKRVEIWQKEKDRIEKKSTDGAKKNNKKNNKKESTGPDAQQIMSDMLNQYPIWNFPKEYQLCSLEHLKKSGNINTPGIEIEGFVGPNDLPKDSSVPKEILTMLASGIGIYTTNSKLIDTDYLNAVMRLAKLGIVKIIFTDSSISYGTNLSVADIIIIDEPIKSNTGKITPSITELNSIKTIFQMLGRAGRGGNLSYQANIYTTSNDDNLINLIKSYTKGVLDEGSRDEISNIKRAFQAIW